MIPCLWTLIVALILGFIGLGVTTWISDKPTKKERRKKDA